VEVIFGRWTTEVNRTHSLCLPCGSQAKRRSFEALSHEKNIFEWEKDKFLSLSLRERHFSWFEKSSELDCEAK
jgi:hypothetical protein